jgi:hypothetical protein
LIQKLAEGDTYRQIAGSEAQCPRRNCRSTLAFSGEGGIRTLGAV